MKRFLKGGDIVAKSRSRKRTKNSQNYLSRPNPSHKLMWTVIILITIGVVGGYFVTKATYLSKIHAISVMLNNKASEVDMLKAKMNRVMKQNGAMMIEKDGNITPLKQEVTLEDGTKVDPNGKVTRPDGSISVMQNGDSLDMQGNRMGTKASGSEF